MGKPFQVYTEKQSQVGSLSAILEAQNKVQSPQITNGHIPTQEAKDYLDVERRKFPAPLGRQRIAAAKAPAGCRDTAQQQASRTGQESSQRVQGRGNDKKVQIALNEAC